jgi:hypothetical protein
MLLKLGARRENVWLCDIHGLVHVGREVEMNPEKAAFAQASDLRRLDEVIGGADLFLGLSGPGVMTGAMVKRMSEDPIILALANPNPEIDPEEARAANPRAIIATGPVGLSEPGQQCPVLSLHLPRGARRRRDHDQRCDADRLRRGDRGARPRLVLGRGGRGLFGRAADLRAGLSDPQAVRSAPARHRRGRGGRGRDGQRRRDAAVAISTPTASN